MTKIELIGLTKRYGSFLAIGGLDLQIEEKEFVALVGPSGSGKSTLLRLIAGLEKATGGIINVDGRDFSNVDPSKRNMAMVFQSYALYPHMNVADNILFPLKMRKIDRHDMELRLRETLALLGLTELRNHKPAHLSGGQRQRVAMGRAIIRQADVLLFDEPLSNLDAKLRADTRVELRQLHDRLGATSIFVTHDQIEAMTLADRIVLLNKGEIRQVGTPEEIYNFPRNQFVASFIGSPEINILTGSLQLRDGALFLDEFHLPASPERLSMLRARDIIGNAVSVGVRPEHFIIDDSQGSSALHATVIAREFTGQDMFLICQVGKARITFRTSPERSYLRTGIDVCLSVRDDMWHVFDITTGQCQTSIIS